MEQESVIKNPPGLMEHIISTIRQETLPMIGFFGGGVVGAASPIPGGALVGAGLGFAAGRQANRVL